MNNLFDVTQGGFLISQIKQVQGRIFEKLLKKARISDLNGAQGRILFVLWQEDNLPIIELSNRTGLAKNTLTSMLERLNNQGYINRNNDINNRRQILITLTKKSQDLYQSYMEVSQQMNAIFYSEFSNSEILQFENYLKRILNNLNESK